MMRFWMHPMKRAPYRMDTKINFASMVYFLFVILEVSWAQNPTPQTAPVSTRVTVRPTTLTGGRVESNVSRDVDSSTKSLHTEQTTNQRSTTSSSVSSRGSVTSAPTTKTSRNTSKITWDPEWDKGFTYDYESLRYAGLIIAGVLFIMGIIVISCGRVYRMPKCHKKSSRSYQVVQQ